MQRPGCHDERLEAGAAVAVAVPDAAVSAPDVSTMTDADPASALLAESVARIASALDGWIRAGNDPADAMIMLIDPDGEYAIAPSDEPPGTERTAVAIPRAQLGGRMASLGAVRDPPDPGFVWVCCWTEGTAYLRQWRVLELTAGGEA